MIANWFQRTIGDYLPAGPTLSNSGAARFLSGAQQPVRYSGEPRCDFPVLPFQLFGLKYDDDIVIETSHPHWIMHEYARVVLQGREIWLAKDSDPRGVQTVNAPIEEIETYLPEIPVPRRTTPVEVLSRPFEDGLDLEINYQNSRAEQVHVEFRARRAHRLERKRNGSTFNHSQDIASLVLDIPRRQLFGIHARVTYDGKEYPVRRILGLAPIKALLHQIQAGFAICSLRLSRAGDELLLERPVPGDPWLTHSREQWERSFGGEQQQLSYNHPGAGYSYRFVDGELQAASVDQPGSNTPLLLLQFSAPLPDLRRPFRGTVERRFVARVHGQLHGHGALMLQSARDSATVQIRPEKPRWFRNRPMLGRFRFNRNNTVDLRYSRQAE